MINKVNRTQLAKQALIASSGLRKKMRHDISSPINIFDLCDNDAVPVRFVEINMEGMYVQMGDAIKPTILISAFRPFHRKVYTCAHEYGHHIFGHGFTVDELSSSGVGYTNEEFLVDTFASYLLMPPIGLQAAFAKRKLLFHQASPIDCLAIACSFGVGYETLINQLLFNSHINAERADFLLRKPLKNIKESIIGQEIRETLFFIDYHFNGKTIDMETTAYLLLPIDVEAEDERYLKKCKEVAAGVLYQAMFPGITRVYALSRGWSCFVRIQRFQYFGLSQYRHLSE